MITIDLTMPIQIVNILILIVIMNIVLYRPIRTILAEREKRISGLEKDVDEFNKNARLRLEEFDAKLNDARSRAKAELDAARGAAQAAGATKVAEIRKEADSRKSESLARIQEQINQAGAELKGQVNGFAAEMAAKVLGRAL
ncbi:MAG: ATP synthase F0 subunit B [Desulfurivibrionaceae bacterium]|nr:ATP synthase F0 subunit B [Desulfobulbales bacterium]MDT8334775.1 ATP synthase F0 subunit B [Desulfurivibrionaceae bacterium]